MSKVCPERLLRYLLLLALAGFFYLMLFRCAALSDQVRNQSQEIFELHCQLAVKKADSKKASWWVGSTAKNLLAVEGAPRSVSSANSYSNSENEYYTVWTYRNGASTATVTINSASSTVNDYQDDDGILHPSADAYKGP